MPSLIDSLKSRPKPPPPNPVADVAAKLKTAQDELTRLEAQYGEQALDALLDNSDTGPLSRKLATAREHVETIRAAHKAALEREQQEIQRQRAELQKAQLKAVKKALANRDAAAELLQTKIKEAAEQFHILLDESAAARKACPVGFSWPGGDLCGDSDLMTLVANALYRENVRPGKPLDRRDFPVPAADDLAHVDDPKAIPELGKSIKDASAYVLSKLTSKATG